MIHTILSNCDSRYKLHSCGACSDCSYEDFCPNTCEKCLDFIHNPSHATKGSPKRKYDCTHMADYYVCKYSCRYTSEIIYALERLDELKEIENLKVLSFGCGPCTDLFAIDFLHKKDVLKYQTLEYRGIDYSKDVWTNVHNDIKACKDPASQIYFYYKDACDIIAEIEKGSWVPNLIVFQYFFSDLNKHTDSAKINVFIDTFAKYYNEKIEQNTCIILNDINLSIGYLGGREFFDMLLGKLNNSISRKGRFCNDHTTSQKAPRGYPYGEMSDGEFPNNKNFFDIRKWSSYNPFDKCGSAQMLIKREE